MCLGWVTTTDSCSYKGLIEYLGLDSDDFQMTSLRPVYNWRKPTKVYVDLFVTSITDVNEKAQSFATQITVVLGWVNDFTSWNASNFCGIQTCTIQKDKLWTPDIGIAESIATEFASMENSYVKMFSEGHVLLSETLILTTACKMDLYTFPFDAQTCTLTLQSALHSINELTINQFSDASFMTASSKKAFQTQGEWDLLSITVSKSNMTTFGYLLDQLKFEITIKRRPLLYIINFISPVFCFLVLDVATFFMDSAGGEKLGFKVTLLLAISVLLLILNDTLPSTANEVPLIGVFCSVIFSLIGISILESILVDFLMARGDQIHSEALEDSTSTVTDSNSLPETAKDRSDERLTTLERLRQILKFRTAANPKGGAKTSGCWHRAAMIINTTFIIIYILAIIVFLSVVGKAWFTE
ncbi:5-hydroxytryptamine receptor 3A-like isoform X3 [Misgurnus anguillicaudatus]|uniref:5-hydroxytryptamine receptor 3A-like isoform X3 n=1 Tax=Misgurnus anguillicaudatus TaxID=75329 RepID=UPI003CCF819D